MGQQELTSQGVIHYLSYPRELYFMESLESIREPSDMIIIKITSDEGRILLPLSNIEMKLINYIAVMAISLLY